MKLYLALIVMLFTCTVFTQVNDSVLIRSKIDSLIKLNVKLSGQSQFDEALVQIRQAKEIALKSFGPLSVPSALVTIQIAKTYQSAGKLKEAQENYSEAYEIIKNEKAVDDSLSLTCLMQLKDIFIAMGDYQKARNIYLDLLPRIEKKWGKESLLYKQFKIDLGIIYRETNEYDKAEHTFLEFIDSNDRTHKEQNPDFARCLINLGLLYSNMGSYEKAKKSYFEARDILLKNSNNMDSISYLGVLQNLGILYWQTGEFTHAEPLFLESLPIMETLWGKENMNYAGSLINLGLLYETIGHFEKAIPLYEEANLIFEEKIQNVEHPFYLNCLHNLAHIYFKLGRFQESEKLNQKVLHTRQKLLGTEHDDYAQSLFRLSELYLKTSEQAKAEFILTALLTHVQSKISTAFSFLSENERDQFIKNNVILKFNLIQSAALSTRNPVIADLAYNAALILKGIQLQTGKNTMEFILQQRDPKSLSLYQDLMKVKAQLAEQYELPLAHRTRVAELEIQKEKSEKELARLSSNFRKDQMINRISMKEIKASLKPGEAAIEFVHFNNRASDSTKTVWYGAMILMPHREHAHFVPLFEENKMSVFLSDKNERKVDYVERLYAQTDRGAQVLRDQGTNLYEIIWRPLDSFLTNVHTIYCSPTGLLNRINLGAIPINDETTIGDKYYLRTLLSTRQVAIEKEENFESEKNALIYGGIQYDYDSMSINQNVQLMSQAQNEFAEKELFAYVARSQTHTITNTPAWDYLKWTKKESEKINDLLIKNGYAATLLTGANASEESFKKAGKMNRSPQMIHIATHGYFYPEPPAHQKNKDSLSGFIYSENPMIRSGILFFGANRVWRGEKKIPGLEDGILTAMEISQMDLSHTQLVVLSACETGLGDIIDNEGVFGLQRAFRMAGVQHLIISLWQVPDFQTQDLMTTFYQKYLEQHMKISEAFRAAQHEMRDKYQNPYFWAGFVLVE